MFFSEYELWADSLTQSGNRAFEFLWTHVQNFLVNAECFNVGMLLTEIFKQHLAIFPPRIFNPGFSIQDFRQTIRTEISCRMPWSVLRELSYGICFGKNLHAKRVKTANPTLGTQSWNLKLPHWAANFQSFRPRLDPKFRDLSKKMRTAISCRNH